MNEVYMYLILAGLQSRVVARGRGQARYQMDLPKRQGKADSSVVIGFITEADEAHFFTTRSESARRQPQGLV